MADIQLTPGTLPPPACYDSEQARFDAYVASIVATITGGVQWEASQVAPADLTLFWLRLDSNNRPVEALQWSITDGAWVRWLSEVISTGVSGGIADIYTITNTPSMTGPLISRQGQVWVTFAVAGNTGPSTLNIDGSGPKPITLSDGVTPLVAGNIVTGQAMILVTGSLGTNFLLINPTPVVSLDIQTVTTEIAGLPGAGTSATVTHGFATAPDAIQGMMVCVTTEAGYVTDEVVQLGIIKLDSGGAGDATGDAAEVFGYSYGPTDLTLTQNAASNGQSPFISGKTDGIMYAFTAANWKFRFVAIMYNT